MAQGRLLAAAVIVVSALAGCSGGSTDKADASSSPTPSASAAYKVASACTATGQWAIPTRGYNLSAFAAALGVPVSKIGEMGTATCDKPISLHDMESIETTPHVSIKGQGPDCVAVTSAVDPSHPTTKNVRVVCAKH